MVTQSFYAMSAHLVIPRPLAPAQPMVPDGSAPWPLERAASARAGRLGDHECVRQYFIVRHNSVMPIHLAAATFEQMVWEAVDELPPAIHAKIANLELVVKISPDNDDLAQAHVQGTEELFGFYQGTPLTERDTHYDLALPDLITIYQRAHENACNSTEALRAEVRRTVRHEIAHHFGISDARLDSIGAY